jgi:UDP-N-acetylglucosamine--N-acetylmuramyl-(pentapeptide) pyrophosphoryl-undecaprenol N-acetylglucosamine transferase
MKILISGGHLTPALAVIDYAQTHFPEDEFVFVGREYSQPSLKQRSWEKPEVSKRNVPFIAFTAPKLDGQPFWRIPMVFGQLCAAVLTAFSILGKHKPDIFVSFGGFLALPIAIAAKLRGIPVLTHEQTRTVGIANQWIARFATAIAVTFPETQQLFSNKNVFVTGNPLRPTLFHKHKLTPGWLPTSLPDKPLLYVTGGNQGSQFMNILIQEGLERILENWWVIHQCGSSTTLMNYKKILEKARLRLPERLQAEYFVREWISEEELSWIYEHADGVLARSGANTVTELMAMGIPALFIPLLQARSDEQRLNAEVMSNVGAAIILPQKEASVITLLDALQVFKKRIRALTRHARELQENYQTNTTEQFYQLVHRLAKN